MRRLKAILAAVSIAAFLGATQSFAGAHSVATRCDWRGCSHIVCNHTGDRCHRFYGDYSRYAYDPYVRDGYGYDRPYYGDGSYDGGYYNGGYYDRGDGWRYDCDSDADNCHVRRNSYDGYGDGWDD